MKNVVVVETIRGGKDPDEYYHIITEELASNLDSNDPWRKLGQYEDYEDEGILASYLDSMDVVNKICTQDGYKILYVMEAVGY